MAPEISQAAARVEDLLQRLVAATGVEATVRVSEDGEGITGEFVGDDVSRLIGHRGQALDAIQHVAYRIAYRDAETRGHLTIDAAGYRERRAVALHAAGDQAAEAAIRDGQPVSLEAMSALERRVVHEHLKGRHDVETYSEGQEPNRRLVVAPLS